MDKKELQAVEKGIALLFEQGKIKCPIHLSGGNEDQLIALFRRIPKNDYIFSTHRNHYHYLLHTGNWSKLLRNILIDKNSMHTIDHEHHFYSSGIVAGCVAIACGVALALKMKGSKQRVWCFVGDGATDSGWFYEATRYAVGNDLPITYVIEDNNRSVCTTKAQRWGKHISTIDSDKVLIYNYKSKHSHVGCGKWVTF